MRFHHYYYIEESTSIRISYLSRVLERSVQSLYIVSIDFHSTIYVFPDVKHMHRLEYPISVQRLWSKKINDNSSDRKTIRSLMNKFEQTGSALSIDPPGRPTSVTNQTANDEVFSVLQEHFYPSFKMNRILFIASFDRMRRYFNSVVILIVIILSVGLQKIQTSYGCMSGHLV